MSQIFSWIRRGGHFGKFLSILMIVGVVLSTAGIANYVDAAGGEVRVATVAINPTTVNAGVETQFTLTFSNSASSTADMKSIQINLPTGFVLSAASPTFSFSDSEDNGDWSIDSTSSGVIEASLDGGSDGIDPADSISIIFTATVVNTGGTFTFEVEATKNNSFSSGGGASFLDGSGNPIIEVDIVVNPPTTETACSDSTDNDGDGQTDLLDSDCASSRPTITVVKTLVNDDNDSGQETTTDMAVGDFAFTVVGPDGSSQSASNGTVFSYTSFSVGTFSVTENNAGTYTSSVSNCSGTLGYDQDVTCTVTNNDNAAPEITLSGAATIAIETDDTFTDPGADATDEEDGPVAIDIAGSVDTSIPGTYTLTYSTGDSDGFTASVTRTVIVSSDTDLDDDGVENDDDNCPTTSNAGQKNNDGDSEGDACDTDDDNDDLTDTEEDTLGTDPFDADSDDDGLTDGEEADGSENDNFGNEGTDPLDSDSDNDGLTDGNEVDTIGTDPNDADTDNGSVNDGDEVTNGTDPVSTPGDDVAPPTDTDGDGIPDATDNCPSVANQDQADKDSDGIGDACDPTDDNSYKLTLVTHGEGDGVVRSSDERVVCDTKTEGFEMGQAEVSVNQDEITNWCETSYAAGTTITLTATPDEGSNFNSSWGGACTGVAPCTLTITGPTTVTAHFAKNAAAPASTGGGSGGGGGGGGGIVNSGPSAPQTSGGGTVLGASIGPGGSTQTGGTTSGGTVSAPQIGGGQVLGAAVSCGMYIDDYAMVNRKNNPATVKKIQAFFGIEETGNYGPKTIAAVRAFQTEHMGAVITPWGIVSSTGNVYLSTAWKINMIKCPELALPFPDPLVPFNQKFPNGR